MTETKMYELQFIFQSCPSRKGVYEETEIYEDWDHIPQIGSVICFDEDDADDYCFQCYYVVGISYVWKNDRNRVAIHLSDDEK